MKICSRTSPGLALQSHVCHPPPRPNAAACGALAIARREMAEAGGDASAGHQKIVFGLAARAEHEDPTELQLAEEEHKKRCGASRRRREGPRPVKRTREEPRGTGKRRRGVGRDFERARGLLARLSVDRPCPERAWLLFPHFRLRVSALSSACVSVSDRPLPLFVCCRAERFGAPYVDPGSLPAFRDEARRGRLNRPGFSTGIDMFSSEEVSKRERRAARFGESAPSEGGLTWQAPEEVEEDDARRRARAARFGVPLEPVDRSGMMDMDLFGTRRELPSGAQPRPEALHAYGVDLLGTNEILRLFRDYGPTYVEWIDDSSCNVLFADGPSAQRALAGVGQPVERIKILGDDAGAQEGSAKGGSAEGGSADVDMQQDPSTEAGDADTAAGGLGDSAPPAAQPAVPAAFASLPEASLYWHKAEGRSRAGAPVPVLFRLAATSDAKPASKAPSRRLWTDGGAGGSRRRGNQDRRRRPGPGTRDRMDEDSDGEGDSGRRQGKRIGNFSSTHASASVRAAGPAPVVQGVKKHRGRGSFRAVDAQGGGEFPGNEGARRAGRRDKGMRGQATWTRGGGEGRRNGNGEGRGGGDDASRAGGRGGGDDAMGGGGGGAGGRQLTSYADL